MADYERRCPQSSSNSGSEIVQFFNSRNAKIVAFFLVIGFVIYHGVIHLAYGIDSCKWLLSDGRFQGDLVWQPYGCMMHTYSDGDARLCMRYIGYWGGKSHIVFVGDSRIRQLYHSFVRYLSPVELPPDVKAHSDLSYSDDRLNLKVEFVWRPHLNDSTVSTFSEWSEADSKPNLVVTGSATWSIKRSNGSLKALKEYREALHRIVPPARKLRKDSRILWMLQDPIVPHKLDRWHGGITNEQVDLYNKAAMEILRDDAFLVWSSSRLVSQGFNEDCEDGIHIGKVALRNDVQILLNMYCNDQMNFNDGTCCSSAEPVSSLQIVTLSIFSVFVALAFGAIVYRRCRKKRPDVASNHVFVDVSSGDKSEADTRNAYELVVCLGKLGIIMGYFFLCDRTNFFMKENKYYSHLNFFLPFAYVCALGLFFTEDAAQTKVLHRDQTDEWKGWMQLVILIYHMTGASQVLPIYMHMRLMVTSYLFLSGYGHFSHFWVKGDYGIIRLFQSRFQSIDIYFKSENCGLRRVLEVLFRLNMLAIVLCLSMNRPYQFYYFVPLVSFWFLVVYATMSLVPQVTSSSSEANPLHYLYMVLKFVGLAGVVTVLYLSEVFFERIFVTRPWKALFVTTDDSIKEWWFRWKIDRYSVQYGMLFGFAYFLLKRYRLLDDHNHGNLFSRSIACVATFGSLVGLATYSGFALLCRNKPECNEVHPYIAFLPILSYIFLRNVSGLLRTRYSTFFAWFGKISLELFVCQYHIWLAADTHGVLVLVPSYPVFNLIVISFIFLCVVHEIHLVTRVLAKYAIPSDWKCLLRNFLLFLMVLAPIGIHDGMF